MASVKKKTGTYHHGDLKKALITASLRIIAKSGVSALSLRGAAKAAGVSHAAPYAHFRDVEDLLAAIKDEGFRALLAAFRAVKTEWKKPAANVRLFARTYLQFAFEHPAMFEIMFHRSLTTDPAGSYTYIESGREIFALATAVMTAALPAGTPPAQIRARTVTAWTSVHGLCSLWVGGTLRIIGGDKTTFDEFAEGILATVAGFQT